MQYEEAKARLIHHGTSIFNEDRPNEESLTLVLDDETFSDEIITELARDVVECLGVANLELNGQIPSETFAVQRVEVVDELAGAISYILEGGIERLAMAPQRNDLTIKDVAALSHALWSISMAWSMVLDGDFDDIVIEVQQRMYYTI